MRDDELGTGQERSSTARVCVAGGYVTLPTTLTDSGFLAIGADVEALLAPERGRRLDPLSQLALLAVDGACANAGISGGGAGRVDESEGVVVGSALGATMTSLRYARRLVRAGAPATNPIDFPDSIDGAPAAHVALDRKLGGPSLTFADGEASAVMALLHAARQIALGRARRMYFVAGDRIDPWIAAAIARDPDYVRCAHGGTKLAAECVFALVLERYDGAVGPSGDRAIELIGFEPGSSYVPIEEPVVATSPREPYRWCFSREGRLRLSTGDCGDTRPVVDPSGALSVAAAWIATVGAGVSGSGIAEDILGAVEPAGAGPIADLARCGIPNVPRIGFVRTRTP